MSDAAASQIKVSIEDGVGLITLSNPATLNAASPEMLADLQKALAAYASDDAVRCIIITGEGRGFCSGALLSGGMVPGEADMGELLETTINPIIRTLRDYPKPTIAAVNGAAAGAGASLALVCDLVVAGESGYFLQAFRRIGLVPDGGATWMLPRSVGKARAMELVLLGDKLPGRTALEWGLINRCVPDAELLPTAMGLGRSLATGPKSLGATRKLIWDALETDFAAQLQAERVTQRESGFTADCVEGITAFNEKRAAVFTGK